MQKSSKNTKDFDLLEKLIKSENLEEIIPKRLPHKGALLINGIMVEFILVQEKSNDLVTRFFGTYDHV